MFRLAEALLLFRYCQILRLAISRVTRHSRPRTPESHEKTETERKVRTRRHGDWTLTQKWKEEYISTGQDMNAGWWDRQSENFHFETYRIENKFLASQKFNIFDLKARSERVGSLFSSIFNLLIPWSFLLLLPLAPCAAGHKSCLCLIFGVNQAALVEVVIGSPDILRLEVWPPMSRAQDPNTDWSHSLILFLNIPYLSSPYNAHRPKGRWIQSISGRTKHLMKYFLCKLRNYF